MNRNSKPDLTPGSPEWWRARAPLQSNPSARSVGRPQTPISHILLAALQLVDEGGPNSLSMRQLAQRLESGTATLYRHFASKDEILVHLVDVVIGEIEVDDAKLRAVSWQDACSFIGAAIFKVLQAHPTIVPLLVCQIPVGPNALAHRERAVAFLLARGFSPELAARAYSAVMHYVFGFASQIPAFGPLQQSGRSQLRKFYRNLNKDAYPSIVSIAEHLPMISDDEEFQFGLQLVIRGLESLAPATLRRAAGAQRKR